MRQTQKLIAAQRLAREQEIVVSGDHELIYQKIEEAGYQWRDGQWQRRPGVDMTATKGTADLRIRAANADLLPFIERLSLAFGQAGISMLEVSRPYPDDRHGVATTSRVYIEVKL